MLANPKSTIRALCMLRHMSSGHMTLLRGKLQPPKFTLPIWTYGVEWTHVGLCH